VTRRPLRLGLGAIVTFALVALLDCHPARAEPSEKDPWERVNRKIFRFNDTVDTYFFEPLAKGWSFLMPELVMESIGRAVDNARLPIHLLNDLLQGKPREGFDTVSRFLLNSTLGAGGLFDPAGTIGLSPRREDFGQTLGRWGYRDSAYVMLPFFGPSTVRDTVGLGVDGPVAVWPYFVGLPVSLGVRGGTAINSRALILEELESAKKGALDYYALVRNAYIQHRDAEIADSIADHGDEEEAENEEDLYYLEEQ
jgi:phospholipid-binding lipoprotein MlaA